MVVGIETQAGCPYFYIFSIFLSLRLLDVKNENFPRSFVCYNFQT